MEDRQARTVRPTLAGRRMALTAVLTLAGTSVAAATAASADGGAEHAETVVRDVHGATVGFARFTEDGTGTMHVVVQVSGMSPGKHGIHVHTTGSCTSTTVDFGGAGGHHNPTGAVHGEHAVGGPHAGDLPNLVVNNAGRGHLAATSDHFTLTEGSTAILGGDGSALIVHAAEDDLITNPTGKSGARIACGVIAGS